LPTLAVSAIFLAEKHSARPMLAFPNRQVTQMTLRILALSTLLILCVACGGQSGEGSGESTADAGGAVGGPNTTHDEPGGQTLPRTIQPEAGETHFGPLRMLTDGGENAEAYFSFDGTQLSFQSTHGNHECDQIFTIGVDGSEQRMVSTGKGRTTCAYFLPGDDRIVYASTHHHDEACPEPPDMSQGYVWAPDGSDLQQLTEEWGYDAEATVSPKGDKIVFTSMRDGDLEIYTMNIDGSDVRRLTDELGYDGGPFFSRDGTKIVYRAHHPESPEDIADYKRLLAQDRIRPSKLEVFVMDADGGNKRQVTDLGAATFAPYFHPSGEKIIFSSNYPERGREFDLYLVNVDGTGLERVTHSGEFDGFPMWGPDGETFVFASNRHNSRRGETNIFVTRWKD
jgi:Tol biopolymer transport system component